MAEPDELVTDVQFISAQDDAAIRLECFRLAQPTANDFTSHMDHARTIYNWVMDFEPDSEAVELATESAPACTRKH